MYRGRGILYISFSAINIYLKSIPYKYKLLVHLTYSLTQPAIERKEFPILGIFSKIIASAIRLSYYF